MDTRLCASSGAVSTARAGLLLLAALAVVLVACGGEPGSARPSAAEARAEENGGQDDPGDVIAVRIAPARREPMSAVYATSATLRADRQAAAIARTDGVIRRLAVEEGDRVAAGQVLAVLEDDEQRIEYDRTRAAFEVEEREFTRAERLYDDELLSHEDYETARRELDEARHAFARAELELERTQIRSPFAGRVLLRHLDVGATVSDGTPVYDLADLEPLYADVNIPERHVHRLAPGQTVRLLVDASGDRARASIERIAPSVDPATGTVKVTLKVNREARLRPGAFVRASIVTETHANALVVPRSALVAEGRRWHLFRFEPEDETVSQLEVVLGFEEGDRVEVDNVAGERALEPGDGVVVVGAPALTDGARVRVMTDEDEEEQTAGESDVETQVEPA